MKSLANSFRAQNKNTPTRKSLKLKHTLNVVHTNEKYINKVHSIQVF